MKEENDMKKGHKGKQFLAGLNYGLAFVVALLLTGCAIHIKSDIEVDGFCFKEDMKKTQGEENFTVLKEKYNREWKLNRGDKNAPPVLGLAMSGGGMRSAAFNIGVLKGLHTLGKLREVDIMSSVSGGSYAMSWYYLQKYNSGESDDVIFDPEGCFQKHLEENGRIVTHSNKFFIVFPEYLFKLGINVVATPFHWLANGLFDWNLNLAPYRWFYQNAIEREFHLTPDANCKGFVNDSSLLGLIIGVDKGVKFPAMRKFLERNDLPSFVINTTATITDDMNHYGADFRNTIFEFTPHFFGSDAYGYRFDDDDDDFPIDIHTAVAVSGAAADSSIFPPKIGFIFSTLNIDLGYNIPNHNLTYPSKVIRHNLLPVPFYFTYRSNNDIRGTSIYLTDGGHSDNLGAFALIRRLCKNIIIVDAEHDPYYQFLAYRKLKARLKKELRVDFSLPAIDKGLRQFPIDSKDNESLSNNVLPKKIAEKIGFSSGVKVSYDEEASAWLLTDRKAGGKTYLAKKEKDKLNIYKAYDGSQPVMKGSIAWFPLKVGDKVEKVVLDVTYIKLSLDLYNLDDYPTRVSDYYDKTKKIGWFKKLTGYQNTPFPHEDTSDISYGRAQFSAYRDLGCHIVTEYYRQQAAQKEKSLVSQEHPETP